MLVIEPLPEKPTAAWDKKSDLSVVVDESDTTRPAKEEVNYAIVDAKDTMVYITKKYRLRTEPNEKGVSLVTLTGCGDLEFDTKIGMFRSANMTYSLVIAHDNTKTAVPLTLSYQLRSEMEIAERNARASKQFEDARRSIDEARKRTMERIEHQRKEAEARAEADRPKPLTPEMRAQALHDLRAADTNIGLAREAAKRLARTLPGDNPEELSEALVHALKASDEWGSGDFLEALGVWGTANCEKALIQSSKSGLFFIKGKAIEVLTRKFKDESVINAMVALFRTDRGAAAGALKRIGPAAEKAVIPLIVTDDFWARGDAIGVLHDIGGERSLRALKRELKKYAPRNNPLEINAFRDAIAAIEKRLAADEESTGDAQPGRAKVRIWEDASGAFDVEASLVSVKDEKVTLKKKKDGKEITVPLAKLAEEDQEYVKEQAALKPKAVNPFE
jgi:hypothetical protein